MEVSDSAFLPGQVPRPCEGQQDVQSQGALQELAQGPRKQVSYRTEIIGGVPIITQTQVPVVPTQLCVLWATCCRVDLGVTQ